MQSFPMFFRTTGRRIVIAGGGEQAAQKARLALKTDARIVLPFETIVAGASFTNTTYAALSMRNGDAFSKRFGSSLEIWLFSLSSRLPLRSRLNTARKFQPWPW